MVIYKNIYWPTDPSLCNEKGEIYAEIHLLAGYHSDTIAGFKEMAEIMRETFPQASDDEIHCGKIHKSIYNDHSIIIFRTYIPKGEYAGWKQYDDKMGFEYDW